MNVERVYNRKLKGYNSLGKKDFAQFVETLFNRGQQAALTVANTSDKRTLAYLYEKKKVTQKEIYTILRKAQI